MCENINTWYIFLSISSLSLLSLSKREQNDSVLRMIVFRRGKFVYALCFLSTFNFIKLIWQFTFNLWILNYVDD